MSGLGAPRAGASPATFIQGMRRSGTTILYDCLSRDSRFAPFYEPLTVDKPTVGGGSGATAEDLFTSTREARRAYLESRGTPTLTPLLNYGSPRRPDLELESEFPPFLTSYLEFLLASAERPLVKFTRMAAKTRVLSELEPHALFIHLVRDPRAVATSHMLGRSGRPPTSAVGKAWFFSQRSRRGRWGAHGISTALIDEGLAPGLRRWPPDYQRVLLVWKTLFETTHAEASRHFGSRYIQVRHEDFAAAPEETLGKLYALMGLDLPDAVVDWARRNVRPARAPFAAGHRAWRSAIRRLDLEPTLAAAGYRDAIAGGAPA